MAFVVTQACVDEVYARCAEVCPVDCIYYVPDSKEARSVAGTSFMVIDPDVCIECGACAVVCPIGAIRHSSADVLESKFSGWTGINARLSKLFSGSKAPRSRSAGDPPHREGNRLVEY